MKILRLGLFSRIFKVRVKLYCQRSEGNHTQSKKRAISTPAAIRKGELHFTITLIGSCVIVIL